MRTFITILVSLPLFFYSHASTIHVGKNFPLKTITEAVQVAKEHDTILVEQGLYREKNLIINKSITLEGIHHPVLDGEHKYEIISIKANDVTVDGFTLQYSAISSITDYAGIKIYNAHNVSILNNVLTDTFFGIYSQYGTNCLIQNNKLTAHNTQ
ncbi:MAG: right-handed parallel beta-helix repeat-containing protein, partial [Bacteroidota bacterium]|nr:right-handed parallel beta-helix repeat-containing protein [Bacteroidota bacterium]